MKKTSPPAERGFTLIELITVVAIIAVLASVAMPSYLAVRNSSDRTAAKLERTRETERHRFPHPEGSAPVIERFEMDWKLTSDYQRIGLEVYSRFRLSGEGEIEFRAPGEDSRVVLEIPFPEKTIEASNVTLQFLRDGEEPREPDNVVYHQQGIFWSGTLPDRSSVRAQIAYTALGTEEVELTLPPATRLSNLKMTLDLGDTPAHDITSFSLTPTSSGGDRWTWDYRNLVSDRSITVPIPGAESPSGRLILLFRFMAFAVLLFGGGFLYMSESYSPKSLDRFRLGHFFLLALTYSLFFVVFGVMLYRELFGVGEALLIASLSSFPLLVLHVARVIDLGFAVKHILPLAALTIAVVVNGVYGGGSRDFFFLGILVLISAYLTITYRPKSRQNPAAAVEMG